MPEILAPISSTTTRGITWWLQLFPNLYSSRCQIADFCFELDLFNPRSANADFEGLHLLSVVF